MSYHTKISSIKKTHPPQKSLDKKTVLKKIALNIYEGRLYPVSN
jgi:hypothetical protein